MKYCPKCKIEKESSEFYAEPKRKDGLSGWCKRCLKEKNKANYRKTLLAAGITKKRRGSPQDRFRQEQVVRHGLAVVEALESLSDY